jgi:hypothetical protein
MQKFEFDAAKRLFDGEGVDFDFANEPANLALVNDIIEAVHDAGAAGVMSVGCGDGVLEYLLSFQLAVRACDLASPRATFVRQRVEYESIVARFVPAEVPDGYALLFCFAAIKGGDAAEMYIHTYRGPCVIIIADGSPNSCNPDPRRGGDPASAYTEWGLRLEKERKTTFGVMYVYRRV